MTESEICLNQYLINLFSEQHFSPEERGMCCAQWGLATLIDQSVLAEADVYKSKIRSMQQTIRNDMDRKAIIELVKQAEGIPIVVLKGVFLGDFYYTHPEKRLSSDIDILVPITCLEEIVMLCKRLGYSYLNGKAITPKDINQYITLQNKDQHFKILARKNGLFMTCLEIHVRLFLQQWFEDENTHIVDDFLNRKLAMKDGLYTGCYHLEIHDWLLYLMIHFIQHFLKNMLEGTIDGKYFFQKKVLALHDIAQIIDKHRNCIDWNYLVSLMVKYKLEAEMLFVLKSLDEIYVGYVPSSAIEKLEEYCHRCISTCFFGKMSRFLLQYSFHDLLLSDPLEIMRSFMLQHLERKETHITSFANKRVTYVGVEQNARQYIQGNMQTARKMSFSFRIGFESMGLRLRIHTPHVKKDDFWTLCYFDCTMNKKNVFVKRFKIRVLDDERHLKIYSMHQTSSHIDYDKELMSYDAMIFQNGYEMILDCLIPSEEGMTNIVSWSNITFDITRERQDGEECHSTIISTFGVKVWHDVSAYGFA